MDGMYQPFTETFKNANKGADMGYNSYTRLSVKPHVVVIGGGTGLSVLLKGLKKKPVDITAIVTVADDGGGSGMLRDDYGILPPGDVRNCILALADEETVMEQLLQHRFDSGRLEGQNMGNLFIAAMTEIYGDFEKAVEKLHELLRIEGKVVPVTLSDVTLCAELRNGETVRGESSIPQKVTESASFIKKVYLDPPDTYANDSALVAIRKADMIVLGPGSLYTSIIPNLLVGGISAEIASSEALKVFICNVMTQPGETDGFTVADCIAEISRYLGNNVIDYVIANSKRCTAEVLAPYFAEGGHQMCPDDNDKMLLNDTKIEIISGDFVKVCDGKIRHDEDHLANIIASLLEISQ